MSTFALVVVLLFSATCLVAASGAELDGDTNGVNVAGDEPNAADGQEYELMAADGQEYELMAADDDITLFSDDIVFTEEELSAWLGSKTGTVHLGASIRITQIIYIWGWHGESVTIDTGEYGIVYDGGYLNPVMFEESNVFLLTGEGVDTPVLVVEDIEITDPDDYFGSPTVEWSRYISLFEITSTGRDNGTGETEGGTAVRILTAGSGDFEFFFAFNQGESVSKISSHGVDAIGVELMDYFNLYAMQIEVTGDNSTAVYAHKGAYIHLSRLSAEGTGAMSVRGADSITTDSCLLTPEPTSDVTVVNGTFLPDRIVVRQGMELYPPGSYYNELMSMIGSNYFAAPFLSGSDCRLEWVNVDWDMDELDDFDTNHIGETVIYGSPCTPYTPDPYAWAWLMEVLDGQPELTIDVRYSGIPCIFSIASDFMAVVDIVPAYRLHFWISDNCSMDDIILWYSDDEGKNWKDVTDEPDIELYDSTNHWYYYEDDINGHFTVPVGMLDGKETLFAIESPGIGVSNVVRFTPELQSFNKPEKGGGDRSGTDRVGWDLWDIIEFINGGGDDDDDGTGTDDPDGGDSGGDDGIAGNNNNPPNGNSGGGNNNNPPNGNSGGGNNSNPPGGNSGGGNSGRQGVNAGTLSTTTSVQEPVVPAAASPETDNDEDLSISSEHTDNIPYDPFSDSNKDAPRTLPEIQPEVQPATGRPQNILYPVAFASLACAVTASGVLLVRRVKRRGSAG